MQIARRLALLEQAHKDRLDRMSEAELMASLDASYGPETGAFFSRYMDGLPDADLDALAAGDLAQSALAWEAFDVWRAEQRRMAGRRRKQLARQRAREAAQMASVGIQP